MSFPLKTPHYELGLWTLATLTVAARWAVNRLIPSSSQVATHRIGLRTIASDSGVSVPRRQLRNSVPRPTVVQPISPPILQHPPEISKNILNVNVQPTGIPSQPGPTLAPLPTSLQGLDLADSSKTASLPKLLPFSPWLLPLLPALPLIWRRVFQTEAHLHNVDVHLHMPLKPTHFELVLGNQSGSFSIEFDAIAGKPIQFVGKEQTHFESSVLAPSLFNRPENIIMRVAKSVLALFKGLSREPSEAALPKKSSIRHTECTLFLHDPLYKIGEAPQKHVISLSKKEIVVIIHGGTRLDTLSVPTKDPSIEDPSWDAFAKVEFTVPQSHSPNENWQFNISQDDPDQYMQLRRSQY